MSTSAEHDSTSDGIPGWIFPIVQVPEGPEFDQAVASALAKQEFIVWMRSPEDVQRVWVLCVTEDDAKTAHALFDGTSRSGMLGGTWQAKTIDRPAASLSDAESDHLVELLIKMQQEMAEQARLWQGPIVAALSSEVNNDVHRLSRFKTRPGEVPAEKFLREMLGSCLDEEDYNQYDAIIVSPGVDPKPNDVVRLFNVDLQLNKGRGTTGYKFELKRGEVIHRCQQYVATHENIGEPATAEHLAPMLPWAANGRAAAPASKVKNWRSSRYREMEDVEPYTWRSPPILENRRSPSDSFLATVAWIAVTRFYHYDIIDVVFRPASHARYDDRDVFDITFRDVHSYRKFEHEREEEAVWLVREWVKKSEA